MCALPIIIAGGGIGGLATAIAIGQTGRSVTLLERAPEFEPIGYGIQLGPNALHVFEAMGLLDRVLAHCSLPEAGMLSDALTDERLVELPMADSMRRRFGQPYAVIHRSDLHRVLLEACEALNTVELRKQFEVVDFEDDGRQVTVRDPNGAEVTGAALIAADGIWSSIRTRLFPDAPPPFPSRYAAFRCVCPIEEVAAHLGKNVVNLRCGTDFHVIHYPLRGGTLFNLVCGLRIPDEIRMDDAPSIIAYFDVAFEDASDEVKALLPLIDRSRFWTISNLQPLSRWAKGRVVLMGDSAHAMVQAMAQGACQAVEDSIVLAAHIATTNDLKDAFSRYETQRHTRATFTQYKSLFMWEVIHATGGWREMRKAKLAELSPGELLDHFDWLYSREPQSGLGRELKGFAGAKASSDSLRDDHVVGSTAEI